LALARGARGGAKKSSSIDEPRPYALPLLRVVAFRAILHRCGLFRLWLVASALWLIVVVVFFYPQVVSPYIEPRAYILTDDLKFFEFDNVSDSEFKAAYQTEIEFPNKVTLFAKDDTPKPVLDTQSKSFYEQHVKPREVELATARWQSLERASATGLLPPLALLLLGLVIGWIVSGFKSTAQKS
jgi:hypothetical protein